MDLGFLVARLTLTMGVLLIVRLIPEAVGVLGEGPNTSYYQMVLGDVILGALLSLSGRGLMRRQPWACPSAMAVWGALAANSLVFFIIILPFCYRALGRPGIANQREGMILMAREIIYGLVVLLSPLACWILWSRSERVPGVDNPLGYWLLFGVLLGGGMAGLMFVLR